MQHEKQIELVEQEVRELMEKQAMGYKLVAYVGRKSYLAKRVMGCETEIWFTPRGRQWRRADRIEAVRPVEHRAELPWEADDDSRPRNFRKTIRRPEWMSRRVDENTLTEDWLSDWDVYSSQYED